MPKRRHIYTIYDMMEERGVFDLNPANIGAKDPTTGEELYEGPVEYPKMFYHPTGEKVQIVPQMTEPTPTGPVTTPARFELIHKIARDAQEEKALRTAGWHDHPAKALGLEVPKTISSADKDAEIAALKAQLAAANRPHSKSAA